MKAQRVFYRCKRCVMPNTKPDLFINKEGICDACRSMEYKKSIDWKRREKEFRKLLNTYKSKNGSNYDCIIPVSGGKDSHYQTYMMKNVYKLNPLLVSFEPTLPSELGRKNLRNLRNFGVDIIQFQKNPIIYKKLGKEAFYRIGDHEWPNHIGIFTIPVQIAVAFNIKLVIWGENSQLEYGGPEKARQALDLDRRWLEEFGGLLGNRVEDMVSDEISISDLKPYIYPNEKELHKAEVRGIFLGSYFKWNAKPQTELMKKYGFSIKKDGPIEGTYLNYENLDCELVAVHDYLKFVKYGFCRACDHACLDIRHGRLTRKKGLETIRKYDGKVPWKTIPKFLKFYNMTEDEFFRVCDSFTNKAIFTTDSKGRLVKDKKGNLTLREFDPQ